MVTPTNFAGQVVKHIVAVIFFFLHQLMQENVKLGSMIITLYDYMLYWTSLLLMVELNKVDNVGILVLQRVCVLY